MTPLTMQDCTLIEVSGRSGAGGGGGGVGQAQVK